MIPAADFPVALYPIEYKHGVVRQEDEYEIQLCAQAICLEEMFAARISEGAIFYMTSHRRQAVIFTQALREKVKETARVLSELRGSLRVPAASYGPKCKRCSIREYCMPRAKISAEAYCRALETEAKEVELL